ncbi:hypothetical protein QL285_032332 [Trifolium repens]|nr:hypothetical protein QL285_032332 [Trifolium repens]
MCENYEKDMFQFNLNKCICQIPMSARILLYAHILLFLCLSVFLVSSNNAMHKVQSGSLSPSLVRFGLNLKMHAQGADLRASLSRIVDFFTFTSIFNSRNVVYLPLKSLALY